MPRSKYTPQNWRFNTLPDLCERIRGLKLKTCPFCDSKAVAFRRRYKGSIYYTARCDAAIGMCEVRPHVGDIHDVRFKRSRGVVSVWNKRASSILSKKAKG